MWYVSMCLNFELQGGRRLVWDCGTAKPYLINDYRAVEDDEPGPSASVSSNLSLTSLLSNMIPRFLQTGPLFHLSRNCRYRAPIQSLLRPCLHLNQSRSISLESLTTPFNKNELRAAATGNPDLNSEYYLVYVGIDSPVLFSGG